MKIKLILVFLFVFGLIFSDIDNDSLKIELQNSVGRKRIDILNELSYNTYPQISNEQIGYGEEALKLAKLLSYKEGEISALKNMTLLYRKIGEYDKSLKLLQKYLEIMQTDQNIIGIAWSYNNLGLTYKKLGNYDPAIKHFNTAIEFYEQVGSKSSVAYVLTNSATAHSMKGEYDLSLELNEKALQINKELNNEVGIANSLNNIGITYIDKGYYEIALEYFLQSLELKEKFGNLKSISNTLHNIGIIYRNLSKYNKAIDYNLRSLKIKEELGEKQAISTSYNNIGIIYDFLNENEKALEYHKKSLAIKQELNLQKGVAISLNNIGKIYLEQEKFVLAEENLQNSLKIKKNIGDKRGIAESLNHLGNLYLQIGKWRLADEALKQCEQLCREMDLREKLKFNYELQSTLYRKLNNFEKSLDYYQLFVEVKDNIFNLQNATKLAELQTIYETRKKQQEIDILTRDNLISQMNLKNQKIFRNFLILVIMIILFFGFLYYRKYKQQFATMAQLKETNATKDKFFSIIAHDLRNPLTAQLSGTKILAKFIDTMDNDSIQKTARELQKNIKIVFDLLNNLLAWARLQQNIFRPDFSRFELNQLLNEQIEVCTDLIKKKDIIIDLKSPESCEIYADKNMIGSVIQNLLVNAIKFSYKKDHITISVQEKNKEIQVSVEDQGVGIEKNDVKKLFKIDSHYTMRGTNNEKGSGLGLILCQDFIKLHKGKIWAESIPAKGSVFYFKIPRK